MTSITATHAPCEVCQRDIRQRRGELAAAWRRRRTCGPRCKASLKSRLALDLAAAARTGGDGWPAVTDPEQARSLHGLCYARFDIVPIPGLGIARPPETLVIRHDTRARPGDPAWALISPARARA